MDLQLCTVIAFCIHFKGEHLLRYKCDHRKNPTHISRQHWIINFCCEVESSSLDCSLPVYTWHYCWHNRGWGDPMAASLSTEDSRLSFGMIVSWAKVGRVRGVGGARGRRRPPRSPARRRAPAGWLRHSCPDVHAGRRSPGRVPTPACTRPCTPDRSRDRRRQSMSFPTSPRSLNTKSSSMQAMFTLLLSWPLFFPFLILLCQCEQDFFQSQPFFFCWQHMTWQPVCTAQALAPAWPL